MLAVNQCDIPVSLKPSLRVELTAYLERALLESENKALRARATDAAIRDQNRFDFNTNWFAPVPWNCLMPGGI